MSAEPQSCLPAACCSLSSVLCRCRLCSRWPDEVLWTCITVVLCRSNRCNAPSMSYAADKKDILHAAEAEASFQLSTEGIIDYKD